MVRAGSGKRQILEFGVKFCGWQKLSETNDLRQTREDKENQDSVWLKWVGYIGIRSWGEGSEAQGLERSGVGLEVASVERSQDDTEQGMRIDMFVNRHPS